MDRDTEKRIVEESRKNPGAFGKIFEEYYPAIYRYALHRMGNVDAANDVAAEVFFKALNKLSGFKWAGVPFSAWLYRIAGNEIIDYYRGRKHEPDSYDAYETEFNVLDKNAQANIEKEMLEAQEEVEKNGKFIEAREALKTLPAKYQEVLTLRFIEDRKILEICAILGKGEGTVKSLISRGVSRLKEYFEAKKRNLHVK